MAIDDLSAPLGQNRPRGRSFRLPVSPLKVVACVLGLFLLTFAGFALFGHDPMGGEPSAKVAYDPEKLLGERPASPASKTDSAPPAATAQPSGQQTVTIIDGSSGQRQEMVVSGGEGTQTGTPNVDQRLLENSRYGLIPVAQDGLKPWRAYSAGSDLLRARAAGMPVVSIVIGGLGVGAAKTNDAIMKLPPAVTLAFTPYGSDPGKLVERARAQKHEVLLQVPMEPYDYPDNDPGPQTLLTTAGTEQNLDRLAWLMSRFQGYVGLANFMGSRFVVSDTAMQPILKDAAQRGLAYLDDGSSPRSVAGQIAAKQNMPFASADAIIDAVPTATEIDRTLAKLEAAARTRGSAVGVASALPVTIERLDLWAKQLESKGILLVPLTTTLMKSKSS